MGTTYTQLADCFRTESPKLYAFTVPAAHLANVAATTHIAKARRSLLPLFFYRLVGFLKYVRFAGIEFTIYTFDDVISDVSLHVTFKRSYRQCV